MWKNGRNHTPRFLRSLPSSLFLTSPFFHSQSLVIFQIVERIDFHTFATRMQFETLSNWQIIRIEIDKERGELNFVSFCVELNVSCSSPHRLKMYNDFRNELVMMRFVILFEFGSLSHIWSGCVMLVRDRWEEHFSSIWKVFWWHILTTIGDKMNLLCTCRWAFISCAIYELYYNHVPFIEDNFRHFLFLYRYVSFQAQYQKLSFFPRMYGHTSNVSTLLFHWLRLICK